MDNLYYIYDKKGYSKKTCQDLSDLLEKSGFKHYQPKGLGGGPGPEQVVLWLQENEFVSGVAMGVLSNYAYDLLKKLYSWFKTHNLPEKVIPILEISLHFQDIKNRRTRGEFRFRIDRLQSKKDIEKYIESQICYLYTSSQKDSKCSYCKETIQKYTRFYLKRENRGKKICQDCFEEILPQLKRGN